MIRKIFENDERCSAAAPDPAAADGCHSTDVPGDHVERALIGNEPGREDEIQGAEVFQEEGDADRGDQGRDARRIAQRLVGHALDDDRQRPYKPPSKAASR